MHSTELIRRGRGKVAIALRTGDVIGTYYYTGICSDFTVEPSIETQEHFDRTKHNTPRTKIVVTSSSLTINFTHDEVWVDNLERFLMGSKTGDDVINILQGVSRRHAVEFTETPEEDTTEYDVWLFPKVQLLPGGAHNLINDDFRAVPMTGEVEEDEVNYPSSPYGTCTKVRGVTTTTSTTTTTSSTTTTTTTAP